MLRPGRILLCWFVLVGVVGAAEPAPAPKPEPISATVLAPSPLGPRYTAVEVAPTKTSIYLGSVSLTLGAFRRAGNRYTATYAAKVFPFFFLNEKGEIAIDCTDEQLRVLESGQRVNFTGRVRNQAGGERRIEGFVTPTDLASGKAKVRVFVSKSIELIFNTTYRFTGQ